MKTCSRKKRKKNTSDRRCAPAGRARVDQAERRPLGSSLTQAARDGTANGHAEYDANLAIDYLDSPARQGIPVLI